MEFSRKLVRQRTSTPRRGEVIMQPSAICRSASGAWAATLLLAVLGCAAASHGQSGQELTLVNPVPGSTVTAFFSSERQHPPFQTARPHDGIDLRAPRGTDVEAAAAGNVKDATSLYQGQAGWGLVVTVDHGSGIETLYAHLDKITVQPGQALSAGEMVGTVGSSGWAIEPHLHFEVRHQGTPVDPVAYVRDWQNGAPSGD